MEMRKMMQLNEIDWKACEHKPPAYPYFEVDEPMIVKDELGNIHLIDPGQVIIIENGTVRVDQKDNFDLRYRDVAWTMAVS